jgi:hypothetical protein
MQYLNRRLTNHQNFISYNVLSGVTLRITKERKKDEKYKTDPKFCLSPATNNEE